MTLLLIYSRPITASCHSTSEQGSREVTTKRIADFFQHMENMQEWTMKVSDKEEQNVNLGRREH